MFCISIQLKTLHSDGLPRSMARKHCILQGFLKNIQKALENPKNQKKSKQIQKNIGKYKKSKNSTNPGPTSQLRLRILIFFGFLDFQMFFWFFWFFF